MLVREGGPRKGGHGSKRNQGRIQEDKARLRQQAILYTKN